MARRSSEERCFHTLALQVKDAQGQGFLFGSPPPPRGGEVVAALPTQTQQAVAARLPPSVRLGTSSWTFAGWKGIVYDADYSMNQLATTGIAAYAKHPLLRTVGLDRAFYRPPTLADFQDLAARTPPDFRFLIKAFQGLTRPETDEQGRTHGDTRTHTKASDLFLDASYAAHEVVGPALRGLKDKCGPIVFQFPPLDLERIGGASKLLSRLAAFLAALRESPVSKGAMLAVEVRNRQLVGAKHIKQYVEALGEEEGVAGHVGIVHPSMPRIVEQYEALFEAGMAELGPTNPLTVRWLLRPNHFYQEAKDLYAPFDALVEEDPMARSDIAKLVMQAIRADGSALVIINNKAEGSAPLSVELLAQEIGRGL
jgi:uncharacterized protein YecE (DUF72 family)